MAYRDSREIYPWPEENPTQFSDDLGAATAATVVVHSIDYDGNVKKSPLCRPMQLQQPTATIIKHNQTYIHLMTQRSTLFAETILMQGSARQNLATEINNAAQKSNGLAFEFIDVLTKHFKKTLVGKTVTHDKLLAPDLMHRGMVPGAHHSHMVWLLSTTTQEQLYKIFHKENLLYYFDDTKISWLMAQTHHIARLRPEEKIEFNFYDDRREIITWLMSGFENPRKQNTSKLIPHNVCLFLHHRPDGNTTKQAIKIQGTGPINDHYHLTYRTICKKWYKKVIKLDKVYDTLALPQIDCYQELMAVFDKTSKIYDITESERLNDESYREVDEIRTDTIISATSTAGNVDAKAPLVTAHSRAGAARPTAARTVSKATMFATTSSDSSSGSQITLDPIQYVGLYGARCV